MTPANITAEHLVNDLAELGKLLSQARQAKSMSVESVAQLLYLQPRQIEAMEKGDFSSFNSAAFVKGHLRAFAKLYGLDGDKLIGACETMLPPPKEFVPVVALQLSTKDLLVSGGHSKIILFFMAGLVVVVAAALYKASSLDFLQQSGIDSIELDAQTDLAELATTAEQQQETAIALQIPEIPPVTSEPQSSPVQSAGSVNALDESAIAPADKARNSILHIEFNDECWVQIKSKDGKILHEKNHVNGDVLDMQVETPVYLWLGRARGVNLSYNGVVVAVPVKPGAQSAQFVIGDEQSSSEIE